jgi:hypothetical protein
MTPTDLIYELLDRAFAAIREAGRQCGNKALFHLADLFDLVPPQLARVADGSGTYEGVLSGLRSRARKQETVKWLDAAIEQHAKRHAPDARSLVHHLCYQALLDLRDEAHQTRHAQAFALADLFHTVPLDLVLVLQGQESDDQLLDQLHDRALQRGCNDWLEQALEDTARTTPGGGPRVSPLPTGRSR